MKLGNFIKIKTYIKTWFESLSDEDQKKLISYIYIALTLFTVSFFGFFAITPTLATITNLNRQYKDNLLVHEALNKKLTNLKLLDFQYSQIQRDLEAVYSAIPKSTKIAYLTRQLENIAAGSALSISRLNFGKVEIYPNTKKDPIYSFTFTIDIAGNKNNVNNFLSKIINFDRIVNIESVTTGQDGQGQYSAIITGRAYFSNK